MDHQHALGALAGAFLIFVGPAAVIGHRLAAEIAFAPFEIGVVDQHDQDLALGVETLEVVPAALGRLDAVADEHQLGACRSFIALSPLVGARTAICSPWVSGVALPAILRLIVRRGGEFGAEQRHRLGPFALAVDHVAARLKAGLGELVAEIGDRLGLAGGRRSAALERVGAQGLHMLRQALRIELGGLGGKGGGGRQGDAGKKREAICHERHLHRKSRGAPHARPARCRKDLFGFGFRFAGA